MIILFTIALAIIPLAGFIAWRIARFRLAERAKAFEAIKHRARIDQQLGGGHPPSWYESAIQQEEFFAGVDRLVTRKGVPGAYADYVLGKEVNVRRLTWYVGVLEDQGASWVQQQMAVADQIIEWWSAEERALKLMFD